MAPAIEHAVSGDDVLRPDADQDRRFAEADELARRMEDDEE
jgi:hypothetical protein